MEEEGIEDLFVRRHFALTITRATEFVRNAATPQPPCTVNCSGTAECAPTATDAVKTSSEPASDVRDSNVISCSSSMSSGMAYRCCRLDLDSAPALALALTDEHRPVDRVNIFG